MPHVAVNGLSFHVQRLGARDAPPSTVMVHGLFTGSLASWFFTCAPAVSRHGGVLLYDLRGHGRTPAPDDGDHRSATQADDLLALSADLAPFHLVGHSFGALVAARFALAHPARVASLVLVEPPVRADPAPDADPEEAAKARAWWWSTAEAERAQGIVDGARGAGDERDEAIRRSLATEPELTDADLSALPARLAVVLGDRSAAVAMRSRIRRVRPDATVVVLPAGHSVQVDAKEALSSFLVGWIDEEAVAYG